MQAEAANSSVLPLGQYSGARHRQRYFRTVSGIGLDGEESEVIHYPGGTGEQSLHKQHVMSKMYQPHAKLYKPTSLVR